VRGIAIAVLAAAAIAIASQGCAQGQGRGNVSGQLDVPDCWSGSFDLRPDFFAGLPYRDELFLRLQRGGDYPAFADGVSIHVRDITAVRARLGVPLVVDLPPEVTPPGTPVRAGGEPALVALTLYLQRSCRSVTSAQYAVAEALANEDGSCEVHGAQSCGENAPLPAGTKRVTSTITFAHIFNGNPEEPVAAERLSEATFDVYLADPRDGCPGGVGAPPRCRGHLTGSFRFYFERGRPAQPFP
jgi:hypothetical protein